MWRTWKDVFIKVVDKHAFLCSKRVRAKSSPWITSQMNEHMHKRDALKLKAVRSNSSRDWLNYQKCRNSVNTEIKRAKGLYYNNAFQVNAGDPRATWRVVNDLYARKSTNSNANEIKLDGHAFSDAQELLSLNL